jgi:hypothetical protein
MSCRGYKMPGHPGKAVKKLGDARGNSFNRSRMPF